MAVRSGVQVLGLDELRRDLRAMDRKMGGKEGVTALNRELNRAADIVAEHTRNVTAPLAGMVNRGSGRRVSSRTGQEYGKRRKYYRPGRTTRGSNIRGRSSKGQGVIDVRAKARDGFSYPMAYEFGLFRGRSIDSPHRPFLYPALYDKREEVMETLADGLTRIMKQYWQHTSGRAGGIGINVGED
jgi:hypothetical protein